MALSIVGMGGGEKGKIKDGGRRPAAHGGTDAGTTENINRKVAFVKLQTNNNLLTIKKCYEKVYET